MAQFSVVREGFDGMDLAYRLKPPNLLQNELDTAKAKAAENQEPYGTEIEGVKVKVSPSGSQGGYAYSLTTGPFGASWFFKKDEEWGLKVSLASGCLATLGFDGALNEVRRTIEAWGMPFYGGLEHVSRVDYAFDVRAYGFALRHDWFVSPSRMTMAHYLAGQRTTSVTLGKMPGAQLIVYDKCLEVAQKGGAKEIWWKIWERAMAAQGLHRLDVDDGEDRIWRVELRAGKDQLRDTWQIKTVADLKAMFPSVLARLMRKVRYCLPSQDTNRSRWPDHALWTLVRAHLDASFETKTQTLEPPRAKAVHGKFHAARLNDQALGLLASMAHCQGMTPKEALASILKDMDRNPKDMAARMEKAKRRYILYC